MIQSKSGQGKSGGKIILNPTKRIFCDSYFGICCHISNFISFIPFLVPKISSPIMRALFCFQNWLIFQPHLVVCKERCRLTELGHPLISPSHKNPGKVWLHNQFPKIIISRLDVEFTLNEEIIRWWYPKYFWWCLEYFYWCLKYFNGV